jgi:serine/threonine-protein kinase
VNDETRLSDDATRLVTSGSGWLTSSGSIDHGRFQPGEILEGRYRVLGLLGRGGMGEVYRADDLRLGQPVALKFLPPTLAQDPVRLAQFHNEVRTARQVSHPNVCRVYDIGEIQNGDGPAQLFITMEYVDGEDLAALLRRIGRFPEDKAVEIARQICAGLAAAHDKGILHRDLKPANIMLDSAGRVRLMDFSLASIGAVTDIRVGTPAYMAPEQLQGREVTTRSDIFALGLVLYELFTGRRVFSAKTVAELVSQHESGVTTTMSDIVRSIDPTVERVIQRCLDPEPLRRPATALAVAAQLSADPLAAALAAGETPSPEMIAAAGSASASLSVRAALAWAGAAVIMLLAAAALSDRATMAARVPLNRSVDVLVDRAQQVRAAFGYAEPFADHAFNFRYDGDYVAWAAAHADRDPWASLPTGRPAAVRFWYRTSPQLLIPFDDNGRAGISDPPAVISGMVTMEVDTEGRVLSFLGVPRQVDSVIEGPVPVVDWSRVFELAGLRLSDFQEIGSEWTPRFHSDERRAWMGEWPELPGQRIRIEAAAYRGKVTSFEQVAPWSRATREVPFNPGVVPWIAWVGGLIVFTLPIGAAWMAWRNWKAGRGDARGALKTAVFVTFLTLSTWVVSPFHVPQLEVELNRFFLAIGFSMFNGGLLFAVYLAVEPSVRRMWPTALITWSRVTTGGWRRDPLVGRDLLIGVAIGAALTVFTRVYSLTPGWLGWPPAQPNGGDLAALLGVRDWYVTVANRVLWALQNALIGAMVVALLRRVVANQWVVVVLATLVFTVVSNRTGSVSAYFWLDLAIGMFLSLVLVATLVRWGLFASWVTFFVYLATNGLLLTIDGNKLYFAASAWLLTLLAGLAVVGYSWSRADEPLFGHTRA